MIDIKQSLDWAMDTIRGKTMFGLDELSAANSRERRALGVMVDVKEAITTLEAQNKKLGDAVLETAEALKKVTSYNKNDGNSPKENNGPESMGYWRWQECISRHLADDCLDASTDLITQLKQERGL